MVHYGPSPDGHLKFNMVVQSPSLFLSLSLLLVGLKCMSIDANTGHS